MFVVRTVENLANSVGKLVCSEKSVGFDHLALAVNPLRFDGIQPRALLRKQATDDPYPLSALFDSAVVGTEPTPHLFGEVPTGVVPDENENLLANGFKLSHAPLEKALRYPRNRPPVHEPDPPPIESGQVESVTAYGFRSFAGVVLGDRPLDEARGLALLGPGVERGQGHPAPPALLQEAHRPGVGTLGLGHFHQSIASEAGLFFFHTGGRGRLSTASPASSDPPAGAKASPAPSPPRRALRGVPLRRPPLRPSQESTGSSGIRTLSESGGASPATARRSSGRKRRGSSSGARTSLGGREGPSRRSRGWRRAPFARRIRGSRRSSGRARLWNWPGASAEHLRSAHGESVFGAQTLLEAFALLFG